MIEAIPDEKLTSRYDKNFENAEKYLENIAKETGLQNYKIGEDKNGFCLTQNGKKYTAMDVSLTLYNDKNEKVKEIDVMNFDINHFGIDFFPEKQNPEEDLEATLEEIEL